ncbi:hypothetical protein BT63DRAFT_449721 [Microthyrium microscopicum]|uniref:Mid2 domain-containing protein n=1 Tax=Microthyrium microscopicum TaxID=703497 RepID=A0A6A6UUJ4_9PEZI|nr:hypothetical protein BT63DRAFT_449721 [Microthyrium microscopicum]
MSTVPGILPLTTTFTPPASCLTRLMNATPLSQNNGADELGPSPSATECYPTGYRFDTISYFSPGLCPQNYTTVSTGTNQIGSLTETVANCCPTNSGFSWVNNGLLLYTTCLSYYGTSATSYRSLAEFSGTTPAGTAIATGPGYAIASAIQVRFQATDKALLTPQATVTSTVTVTAATGLTTGAKVGIGIGVPIALLLLPILAGVILLLRQRSRQNKQHGTAIDTEEQKVHREMDGAPVADNSRMFELDSQSGQGRD